MRTRVGKAVALGAAMGAVMACGSRTGLLDDGGNSGLRDAGPDTGVVDSAVDVFETEVSSDACAFSCDGQCVDPQTDRANCGACGNACPADESCVSGVCLLPCEGGLTACPDGGEQACVDTDADETNCGACGLDCRAGRPCVGGHCTVPNCAQALAPPVQYQAGTYPGCFALGDLNADGILDVVAASQQPENVSVLLGNGDGTLRLQQTVTAAEHPGDVAIGDLNGDGRPDLVVTDYDTVHGFVDVLLGNGDGTFQAPVRYPAGGLWGRLALGDLNNDGWLDAVNCNRGPPSSALGILLGNGDGTLRPITIFPIAVDCDSLALSDLNGDGRIDLVIANPMASALSAMLGQGDGTFGTETSLSEALNVNSGSGFATNSVAVADLNHDGVPDIVFVSYVDASTYGPSEVRLWLGVGDGTFRPPNQIAVGSTAGSVDIGDVNADGDPDLVVNEASTDTVTVLLGRGDGTFQSEGDFGVGIPVVYACMLRLGDLNGDGRSDVVVAGNAIGPIAVLLSTCTP